MTILSEKERVRDALHNWRQWSLDCHPDYAEVYYYVVSPDFAGTPCTSNNRTPPPPYDSDGAEVVEEVLRKMFRPYPRERALLIEFYTRTVPVKELAIEYGFSVGALYKRLDFAMNIFGEVWKDLRVKIR
jgi:hypothetical protein